MATTGTRRTSAAKPRATKPAGKREIRMPSRFSKDYPVDDPGAHGYLIRAIPDGLWSRVVERAETEDLSIRFIAIRLLEMYAAHGLGPLSEPTTGPYSNATLGRPGRRR